MSIYICPACQSEYDDDYGFCHKCGARLVEKEKNDPALNLGDANAISGGVSINQSKNISSHDTHYHSTTVERVKSESELKLEASNQLRAKAEEIMAERGRIDSVAMNQLRPLSKQLGIDEETFKSIIKDVRSNRNGAISGLSAANARYLQQAQQAVKTNDMDALSNLTPRLEAMAAISQDDNVQFMYYLTLSILYPIKSMEVYERQMDENYWRTFWAIISYIRTGKHAEATKVLALFDPLRYEKSEEDQNLLEAYFNIMKEDKDGAQEFLDEILGEPTEQVKPLLRAVESTLYEEEPESLEVRFFMERVMSKSDVVVKSQKKTETPTTKEEPAKTDPKPEKKAEPQPKAKDVPAPEIKKDNKEVEELYAKACAASGAKRVMLLQKAADAGSLEAMYDLSDCYYDGEGVEKNMPLAIKWITKAADAGYVKAQTALGAAYFQGMEGLDQNYALSEKYLLMAANKDNTDAQAFLAYLYIAMEDYSKAMVWARKAAQMEHPQACFALGKIYDEGLGVEVDHKEGLKWFEKAAKNGDADAQNTVGNIYLNADYVKNDPKKAFKYYQMAASQGHLDGMANLGYCYQEGIGTNMNIMSAEEWLRKAADIGHQDAIDILNSNPLFNNADELSSESSELGVGDVSDNKEKMTSSLEDEQIDKANSLLNEGKQKEAFKIYKELAEKGNARAQGNYGNCLLNAWGTKQNLKEGIVWLEKSVNQGFAWPCLRLAEAYLGWDYNGKTIQFNAEKAKDYLRKSISFGADPEEVNRIAMMTVPSVEISNVKLKKDVNNNGKLGFEVVLKLMAYAMIGRKLNFSAYCVTKYDDKKCLSNPGGSTSIDSVTKGINVNLNCKYFITLVPKYPSTAWEQFRFFIPYTNVLNIQAKFDETLVLMAWDQTNKKKPELLACEEIPFSISCTTHMFRSNEWDFKQLKQSSSKKLVKVPQRKSPIIG